MKSLQVFFFFCIFGFVNRTPHCNTPRRLTPVCLLLDMTHVHKIVTKLSSLSSLAAVLKESSYNEQSILLSNGPLFIEQRTMKGLHLPGVRLSYLRSKLL